MVRRQGDFVEHIAAAAFSGTDLACRRGGRLVFSGLNFKLEPGAALVLRGANGSGKTTLLRLMAGLIRPTRGTLLWDGKPVDDLEAHGARLRFIGHLDAVKPALSVAENLAFWQALWGGADAAIDEALGALDLAHFTGFSARLLSAGQRHRLALSRLLAAPAPLWLLDEPGNALDERSLVLLADVIARHRATGGMVVAASHGAAPLARYAELDVGAFGAHEAHWSEAV
jgi:heme exporter protein A